MKNENIISISSGNRKTGNIPSLSFPAVKTCRKDAPCVKKCYAVRMEKLYPNTRNAYERNLKIWIENPELFEIEFGYMSQSYCVFRLFVSGDFPSEKFFKMVCRVAERNKNTVYYAYTKKFDMVNRCHDIIPKNLKIIFSAWDGLNMENPFNFPVSVVVPRGQEVAKNDLNKVCGGGCDTCNRPCWKLRKGQKVLFKEH